MKPIPAFFLVFGLILTFVLGGLFLFFKGASWFVSSIDGDRIDRNVKIVENYYYDPETHILLFKVDEVSYREVESRLDSLSFNNDIIVGFSSGTYFAVNIATDEKNRFSTRDSLIMAIPSLPVRTVQQVPGLSK